MNITDMLARTGGLQSIAQELGLSEGQAKSGAEALLPAILGGFKKQAVAPAAAPGGSMGGGLDALGGLLGKLGGGSLLENVLAPQPTDVSKGNAVLGQIFGSKDVSRTVAQHAASQTGLDTSQLKKMLPMVAMLVAGYMSKQQATGSAGATATQAAPSGGLGGLLGGLLGGRRSASGSTPTGGGLASMLDVDGDGNPLDDILRMAGKMMQ